MKLRIRPLESKETLKIQVSNPCSVQHLKDVISRSIPLDYPAIINISLNRNDQLQHSSPNDSLQSLGITSGDLIFYTLNPDALLPQPISIQSQTLDIPQPLEDQKIEPHPLREESKVSDVDMLQEHETLNLDDTGNPRAHDHNDECDQNILMNAVHAILLESGFVRLDPAIQHERASKALHVSISYTFPRVAISSNNYAVVRFQSLSKFVMIYGSLSNDPPGLYRACFNTCRFAPAIRLVWSHSNSSNEISTSGEVLEFWRVVKDKLSLPLMIDICERNGLVLPPCLARLPTDIKLLILEKLRGNDIAKVSCVSKEFGYLCTDKKLWKLKFMEEFGDKNVKHVDKMVFGKWWTMLRKSNAATIRRPGHVRPLQFGWWYNGPHPFPAPNYSFRWNFPPNPW